VEGPLGDLHVLAEGVRGEAALEELVGRHAEDLHDDGIGLLQVAQIRQNKVQLTPPACHPIDQVCGEPGVSGAQLDDRSTFQWLSAAGLC